MVSLKTTYIMVGGASALVGAVAGYFFCKYRAEQHIEVEVDRRVHEELRRFNRTYGQMAVDESEEEQTNTSTAVYDIPVTPVEVNVENFNPYEYMTLQVYAQRCREQGLSEEEIQEELKKMQSQSVDEEMEEISEIEEDEDLEEPQRVMDEWDVRGIEIVTEEEYLDLPAQYFEFLTYKYFDDDVLLDDGDEIIDGEDIERLIGGALNQFEIGATSVYVMNGHLAYAIEIERQNVTYQEWLGY